MGSDRRAETPDLTDPALFDHWTTEKVRFQDINRFDHVSNVAIAAYAESGRVEFLGTIAAATLEAGDAPYWVVGQLNIRFLAETRFPGSVRIGTRVVRIGNSSVTLGQGMFHDERCVATTESVVVLVDPATGRGTPLPAAVAGALEASRPRGQHENGDAP